MSSATDTFTDTAGTALQSHTADTGQTWAKDTALSNQDAIINGSGRIRTTGAGSSNMISRYAISWTPPSADYGVYADAFSAATLSSGGDSSVLGRMSSSVFTNYAVVAAPDSSLFILRKAVSGTQTTLASVAHTFSASETNRIHLKMSGTTISGFWGTNDANSIGSVTDSAISATGSAGVLLFLSSGLGASSDSLGTHLDNFLASAPQTFSQALTATASAATATMQRQTNKAMTADAVVVTASIQKQVSKIMVADAVAATASMLAGASHLVSMLATSVATAVLTAVVTSNTPERYPYGVDPLEMFSPSRMY